MSWLDVITLAAAIAWLFVGGRRLRWATLAILALLMALQVTLEGYLWQMLPAYALVPLAWLLSLRPRLKRRWLAIGMTLIAAGLILAPWCAFPPIPSLPRPTGSQVVGTQVFRWVDPARPEPATADPNDHRNVIVQAWYPAQVRPTGVPPPYIDGLGHLPPTVSGMPSFLMRHYGRIDIHAIAAPMSSAQRWPVVIFSPGYGAPRAAYTGLVTELASRGYAVLALDHPYESAVTQLADGRIVGNVPGRGDLIAYMVVQQDIRAADIAFVLDQIDRGAFGPALDTHRLATVGHSFGGASSVLAMSRDSRIKAAVNIDGTPYGALPAARLDRPFLLIESDPSETQHGALFNGGNGALLANDSAATAHLTFAHANHYSFTDAPMTMAPPARWASTLILGGSYGAAATQRTTADALVRFLTEKAGF